MDGLIRLPFIKILKRLFFNVVITGSSADDDEEVQHVPVRLEVAEHAQRDHLHYHLQQVYYEEYSGNCYNLYKASQVWKRPVATLHNNGWDLPSHYCATCS